MRTLTCHSKGVKLYRFYTITSYSQPETQAHLKAGKGSMKTTRQFFCAFIALLYSLHLLAQLWMPSCSHFWPLSSYTWLYPFDLIAACLCIPDLLPCKNHWAWADSWGISFPSFERLGLWQMPVARIFRCERTLVKIDCLDLFFPPLAPPPLWLAVSRLLLGSVRPSKAVFKFSDIEMPKEYRQAKCKVDCRDASRANTKYAVSLPMTCVCTQGSFCIECEPLVAIATPLINFLKGQSSFSLTLWNCFDKQAYCLILQVCMRLL